MPPLTDDVRSAIKAQLTAIPKPPDRPNRERLTTAGVWVKPHLSDALGVSPDQIEEARAALRLHGIAAEFTKDGRAIITSERQYRDIGKALGIWSGRDGFQIKDEDGRPVYTGTEGMRQRRRFEEAVMRGDIEF